MNIDFKNECERQLLSLDTKFNNTYKAFSEFYTAQQLFRGVCVATARQSVNSYRFKLEDKAIKDYYGD